MHALELAGEVCGAALAIGAVARALWKGARRVIAWGSRLVGLLESIDRRFDEKAEVDAEQNRRLDALEGRRAS